MARKQTVEHMYELIDACAEMAQHLATGADDQEIIDALEQTSKELAEVEAQLLAEEAADHARFASRSIN